MPQYFIAGYPVDFPFEPYQVQKDYMAKVIQSLENSQNAMLESPTGTGKTLSLLCSSLAWLLVKKAEHESTKPKLQDEDDLFKALLEDSNRPPKIIYASRTHTQLAQAMQEMKRSGYSHLRAVVIGSRSQMCIHPEISKETNPSAQINQCKYAVKRKQCTYHTSVEHTKNHEAFRSGGVIDIEDLVTKGRELKTCPYFMSKELYKEADVVFMPYNYILDPKSRRANQIEVANTAVILDEAHNVEKMCEESMSLELTSTDVASAIADVTWAMEKLADQQDKHDMEGYEERKDISLDDLATFKEILLALEKTIDVIRLDLKKGVTFGGEYVYEFLSQASITFQNFKSILSLIENTLQYFAVIANTKAFGTKGASLQKLSDLLVIVFAQNNSQYMEKVTKCYRVHVDVEEQNTYAKKDGWLSTVPSTTQAKSFNFWCFSPGFAMSYLNDVRSVILTSGTLAPMRPLISEMGIDIPILLENPHIVSQEQVCVKVISQGSDKEPLISNYNNRDNPKYITSLGRTILSFTPVIPGGVLIFFPSYTMLNKCQTSWQDSGLWSQISNIKPIFVEARNKNDFQDTMVEYYARIQEPGSRGAIFMAVCRGKVSEGLDFADLNGRAVFIPGLPFPPLFDPRVVLKKQYLDENKRNAKDLVSGNDWYSLEASRAVNQAIGRVIRHKNDYGAILLCDSRFQSPQQKNQLSRWVQGHLNTPGANGTSFGPLIGEVSRFFRNAEKKFGNPENQIKRHDYGQDGFSSAKALSASDKSNTWVEKFTEAMRAKASPQKSVIDTYRDTAPETSSLHGDVKSIDFNDVVTPYEGASSSKNPPQSTAENAGGTRKRKYKLVENDKPEIIDLVDDSQPIEVPENSPRVDILKLVKQKLNIMDYKAFMKCLNDYNQQGNFVQFFQTLSTILHAAKYRNILRAMKRFAKGEHKDLFERDLSRVV
uniref:Regulator of telomere elongation helicase 1 homolog n=1 Tax=Lutzomyia longipalpis TaxID=7200 RepID=A0A1B0CHR4_LUTLO